MAPRPPPWEQVNVRGVALGGGAVVALAGICALVAWAVIAAFGGALTDSVRPQPQVPSPALQSDPLTIFAAYQRAEQAQLGSYGWIDHEKGEVHIPIEQAIRLLSQGPPMPAVAPSPPRARAP